MAKESLQDEFQPLTELRKLLMVAKKRPLGFVVALSPDKSEVLLQVDKRKKGKKLAVLLKKEGAGKIDPITIRFGYAAVDPSAHELTLAANKDVPGPARMLLKKVAKAAARCNSIVYHVDEAVEADEEDSPEVDDEIDDIGDDDAAAEADDAPADAAPEQAPGTTPAGMLAALDALKLRIKPVLASDKPRGERLAAMWTEAHKALDGGADVAERLSAIEAMLDAPAPANAAAAPAQGGDGGAAALAKADQVWRSQADRMRKTLDRLKTAILDAYADMPAAQAAVRANIDTIDGAFDWMDDRLSASIGAAIGETDHDRRLALTRESCAIVDTYLDAAKSRTLIAELDGNPFGIDTKFRDTIDKTMPMVRRLVEAVH